MSKLTAVFMVAASSLSFSGCAMVGSNGLSKGEVGPAGGQRLFSASKQTSDYVDQFSRGIYAAAGIGPSRIEPDTTALPGWDPNDRVEPAGQVTLGADLTKHLSIEAHSADLGSAGLSPGGRINYHINGASALIYAGGNRHRYRRQGLKGYGRVGLGVLKNTAVGDVPFEKRNATHVLFGAGVEYMTPIGVGLRIEGISFDTDAKYAQLALMYRTGVKTMKAKPKLVQAPKEAPVPELAAALPPVPLPVIDQCVGVNGELDVVSFDSDSARLSATSKQVLDEIASRINSCLQVELEVSAYTDGVGSARYNQSLSRRRAESVIGYLSARGVSKNQLRASAFGETAPIDSNKTAAGRARNRRVEIHAR